jgi:hypothetical protein
MSIGAANPPLLSIVVHRLGHLRNGGALEVVLPAYIPSALKGIPILVEDTQIIGLTNNPIAL